MAVQYVLAQMTVSDLDAALAWYAALFGRKPDARPMDGLLEWHLIDSAGFQVWTEPGRAGRSTMVLAESDLSARATQLNELAIPNRGVETATSSRVIAIEDPDGNRIVFTGQ